MQQEKIDYNYVKWATEEYRPEADYAGVLNFILKQEGLI